MNKTVNINISGVVFHIEEDAYEALKKYMHEIKGYFSNTADDVEVVTDIENRIAEMFTEKLAAEKREVIVLADVEAVIAQIGRISDFEEADFEEKTAQTKEDIPRRLFRDPDDKKLAGVCSGLSHYFGWDPVWLRIILACMVIFYGVGILVYILLWIVVPEAKTLSDKMAMKGEQFHLSNFQKSFDQGMDDVKEGFHKLKNEAGKISSSASGDGLKNFVNEVIDLIAALLRGLGKIIIPIIAIFMIAGGVMALMGTFAGMSAFVGLSDFNWGGNFPVNVVSNEYINAFSWSLVGLVGIPSLVLLLLGLRVLLKKKLLNGPIALGLLVLWLVSLCFTVYYSTKTATAFRDEASVRKIVPIKLSSNNTYYLETDAFLNSSVGPDVSSHSTRTSETTIVVNGEDFHYSYRGEDWNDDVKEVEITIEKSNTTDPALVEIIRSHGKNFDNAIANAKNVSYSFTQTDSIITFDKYFTLQPNALWRAQEVDLTLQLPENSIVVIDNALRYMIENHEYYDTDDYSDIKKWVVTEKGLMPLEKDSI